jgi:hypothetical protein
MGALHAFILIGNGFLQAIWSAERALQSLEVNKSGAWGSKDRHERGMLDSDFLLCRAEGRFGHLLSVVDGKGQAF